MGCKAREHYGAADNDEREAGNHEAHARKQTMRQQPNQ